MSHQLRRASESDPRQAFTCGIFEDPQSNAFVELWAPRIHSFVEEAIGPYGVDPLPGIHKVSDAFHMAGANASFNIITGQISLGTHLAGNPGVILEKLTHEMLHGSLAKFPEGDPYYEEGWVDYSTWVLAHAPVWGEHREAMIKAAADNIRMRRERALKSGSDYDRKRWSGGLYASVAYGPYIVWTLRQRKAEGNLVW